MKLSLWIILIVTTLLNAGCLNPITDRLDSVGTELNRVNTQLAETNNQLEMANARLVKIEESLRTMNGNE
jgi:outer membrane murein-binding lipoprotein Lpp